MENMYKQTLIDVYHALKACNDFTNIIQSKEIKRKDIEDIAYSLHTKIEPLIKELKTIL